MKKMELAINLTQHDVTVEQIKDGVLDIDTFREEIKRLLTFTSKPSSGEVEARAKALAGIAMAIKVLVEGDDGTAYVRRVLIGGAPYLMRPLELALLRAGFIPCYAFSEREAAEEIQPDGSVKKTMVFRHKGLIFVPKWNFD